ncbi:hypothetical protein SLEP1_g26807 [Rubroshorea leprosula]|uniref:Uncharacterized protein n=1 Tax=Rubroshorea leprosula TaxID=152421 RepID=A0AAV5K0T2_9ROSI|nr:hypothetical protein SLEP1_g26807 [Rubroshorea leprosula]
MALLKNMNSKSTLIVSASMKKPPLRRRKVGLRGAVPSPLVVDRLIIWIESSRSHQDYWTFSPRRLPFRELHFHPGNSSQEQSSEELRVKQ